jgi:DNA topoisomerase-2
LNGASGIGTGWSTDIPCFRLADVVNNLKFLIDDEESEMKEMTPFYKGFKGLIVKISQNKWKSYGCIKYLENNVIEIYELPIGTSKQEFKEMLDKMSDDDKIKSYELNNNDPKKTSNDICFKIRLNESVTKEDNENLIKLFKLESNVNGTNMMAFNDKCVITKYGSADDILWEFYKYRLTFYQKRKDYLLDSINSEIVKVSEQLKFITMIVNNEMVIFKKEDEEVMKAMKENKFVNITKLLTTPIIKFTKKEIEKLTKELGEYEIQLSIIKNTSIKKMWLDDLDKLNITELEKVWVE